MPWLPAALAAVALLCLPGAVVLVRGPSPRALAALGPFSVAVISVVALSPTASFSWWQPVAVGCIVIFGTLVLRLRLRLRSKSSSQDRSSSSSSASTFVATAIAVLLGGFAVSVIVLSFLGSADRISQTYDGVFHLNAVARIMETGDASSFDLYRLNHFNGGLQFYPGAWHALVAETAEWSGAGVPTAMNVAWVAVVTLCYLPGIAYLTDSALPEQVDRRVAIPAAVLSASALAPFPYLLLSYGTLYPNALAYALLPFGVGLTIELLRHRRPSAPLIALFAVWAVASVFAHPRSIVSWLVIALPLVVAASITAFRVVLAAHPLQRRRVIAVTTGIAAAATIGAAGLVVAILAYYGAAGRPIADRLNGGPATAREPFWAAALQGVTMTGVLPSGAVAFPAVLLVLLFAGGVILAVRRRAMLPLLIAYLLVALLFALAAGSNSDLAKVMTGLWYKDKFRLIAVAPILAVPFIGLASERLVTATRRKAVKALAIAAVGVAMVSGWIIIAGGGTGASLAQTFALPAHQKDGAILDKDEQALLQRLDSLVPPGQLVVGNPWNGSALSGIYSSHPALYQHLTGDWDPDRVLIATSLDRAAADPAVCAALDRLDAHYVVADPELLYGGDPTASFFSGIDRAVGSPSLTEIANVGSATLWRITACDR